MFGIGGGIGLPLAGVILDHLDVSWIFWVNVLALPAALAAYRIIPTVPTENRARIDWLGVSLLSVALDRAAARGVAGLELGLGISARPRATPRWSGGRRRLGGGRVASA